VGLTATQYQRMLWSLLPPSRLWRFVGGVLSAVFAGCAQELARLDARAQDLIRESVPSEAVELLPEYERDLDLAAAATIAERQASVVARTLVKQGYRPVDFQVALAKLLAQRADDVVVIERSRSFCISVRDDREIFRFFIYRDPSLPGTYYLNSAQEIVNAMCPSHTIGHVIESISMLCDDPHSLCDRDLLGA
jgi:uncharacterized protein YmfQ (DUF2313 family)